jgi:hypothetical protein
MPVMPAELSNEQRRQLIDVQQTHDAWRHARDAARGHMRWLNRRGTDYLHHKMGQRERSLGPRSEKTEERMHEHKSARERLKRTGARLKTMARVNRALRLNRVPIDAARVLRALDDAHLLGEAPSSTLFRVSSLLFWVRVGAVAGQPEPVSGRCS